MLSALFLFFLVTIIVSILYWTIKNGISPMPTSAKVKKRLLEEFNPKEGSVVAELGSGWATLAAPLAKMHPDCHVIGYETSFIPFLFSKIVYRLKNLTIKREDFFAVNLSDVDCVICYLYPDAMEPLKKKCINELKRDALVISHTFAFRDWQAEKIIEVDDLYKTKIFFYRC